MAAHPKPMPSLSTKKPAARLRVAPRPVIKSQAEPQETIPAARAKAHFLKLLDQVEQDRKPVTITKRGRVVAQLVPVPEEKKISNFDRVFGSMAGTGRILGDIVSPDWEEWGPEWR